MQSNKLLKYVAGISIAGVLLFTLFGGGDETEQSYAPLARPDDHVSGDTTVETLNQLSAQISQARLANEELVNTNKRIQKELNELRDNPPIIIEGDGRELEEKVMEKLQSQLEGLLADRAPPSNDDNYTIGGSDNSTANTHRYGVISDMSIQPLSQSDNRGLPFFASHNNTINNENRNTIEEEPKPIPIYTIPENAMLTDVSLLTTIIGRVPVDGSVHNPFTFDVIIGRENLAANGIEIPNIASMRMSGYAVGDGVLKCTQGWITSSTFVFDDSTIHTVSNRGQSSDYSHTNTNALGQIRDVYGNPCIPGVFVTNAPQVVAGSALLGGAAGAANAYSQMQTTTMQNALGGTTTTIDGNHAKFLLGQGASGSMQEILEWWKSRMKDSFDVVYVKPFDTGTGKPLKVAISITNEIPIDYNPTGRRTAHVQQTPLYVTPVLD